MKHNANSRRGRNRGNGKRHVPLRSQTFESSGPDGKIRGTAQQVLDRYLALGRDASSSGDPITAEGFFQHAEHYYRLLHASDGSDAERAARMRAAEAAAEGGGDEEALEPVGEEASEDEGRLPA
jgi:Domain of unknown function (DUF4167)